ncbi:MAG TPA: hypothetical protein VG368_00755 [Acidimicrobiales bacterium]|nr:hypothetical protein [Acidimicrobiales bacterium]
MLFTCHGLKDLADRQLGGGALAEDEELEKTSSAFDGVLTAEEWPPMPLEV